MTGPEHYREAEKLLESCALPPDGTDEARIYPAVEYAGDDDGMAPVNSVGNALAAAHVHATLALAAATAYPAIVAYTGDETGAECRAWSQVTG